jgi:putative transposase
MQVLIRVGVGAPARENSPVLKVVQAAMETQSVGSVPSGSLLDEIAREGARRMLAAALRAEADAYVDGFVDGFVDEVDADGHRLVVRNGHHEPRTVTTAAGAVEVRAPRVDDKRVDESTGERRQFKSAILPAWCRRSPKIGEVLPLLYLHGLSGGDFVPALEQFLGTSAGLSAKTVGRLCEQWQDEQRVFAKRDLSGVDYVYCWADGIHVNIRLGEDKLCLLVLIGVRADGTKELITLADGYRESAGSWADLLRDAKRRGMHAPVLAVGDGALGFWNALREVFPETREARCWFHKIAINRPSWPGSRRPVGVGMAA